jgi:NADH-quinone oxidoreductase subunit A
MLSTKTKFTYPSFHLTAHFFNRRLSSSHPTNIGTLYFLFGTLAGLLGIMGILQSHTATEALAQTSSHLSFLLNTKQPLYCSLYFDTYYSEYGKILITFLITAFICFLLFILSYFFSFANQKEYEKTSEYECGFEPFDSATRQPYDVHFYMVGILFLIFDVEIALLFPWAANLSIVTSTGFWSTVVFLIILTIGFVYEWQRGALSWPHPTIDLSNSER